MSLCEVYIPPEECAKCRFCCSYRRCSLWETALIDKELLEKLKKRYPEAKFKFINGYDTINLDDLYKTNDPEEEALCYFNDGKGCILGEDKPFECRVWPLRVLRKDKNLVIAFSTGCPVFAKKTMSEIRELVSNGLGEKLLDYAKKFPAFIKDYKDNYKIVKSC